MSADSRVNAGTILEAMPNELYRVRLDNGAAVLCHVGREMKRVSTRILAGERVEVSVSPYDPSRGRIVRRYV